MIRFALITPGLLAAVSTASAQPFTATITTTANGQAAATAQPGEWVQLRVVAARSGGDAFKRFAGGTVVTANAGTAEGFHSTIPLMPIINFGQFAGGSRLGADIWNPDPSFPEPTAPFYHNPVTIWSYILALDTPGTYEVNWVPAPETPSVVILPSIFSSNTVEAESTYIGATITVVPAPVSLTMVALGASTASRRRR